MISSNYKISLKNRPVGLPKAETWDMSTSDIPKPAEGEFLVKVRCLSIDPAMRAWLYPGDSYIAPVQPGEVMRALGGGDIIESAHPDWPVGTTITGLTGLQQYSIMTPRHMVRKVDTSLAPLEDYLGVLGISGLTAYFGLKEIGQLKEGETLLVSAAAGSVGAIAVQIGKIMNCKTIGIAGGHSKCDYLKQKLNIDHSIDYKNENLEEKLSELCPEGIDVFFDNVGGRQLEVALNHLRHKARIVICGAISQYNSLEKLTGPGNYMQLLSKRARMEGFVVMDYENDYETALKDLASWIKQHKLVHQSDIHQGLENFPDIFQMLFDGRNKGKLLLKI